jgi:signal transduction histidine kinase
MGQLLDEILELSRVGRIVSAPERVTVHEVVESALSLVAGAISEKKVEVSLDLDPGILFGDRVRLTEIWQNLLENAVKFMGDQPAPAIEIGAEGSGRDTVFFVRDNGIGIDPPYREKIFGLFEKLDGNSQGSGIGLALVSRIVDMYRGTIWVESDGPGKGACFRFTLPEACAHDERENT